MRLVEDVICVILLICFPDFVLKNTKLYRSMQQVIKERQGVKDNKKDDRRRN
nr:MAG TPA: hypothetical protein [Caudoviricetes sp.]